MVGLNKYNICQCGCRGRHAYDGLFEYVDWVFQVLVLGEWPSIGFHDEPLVGWRQKKVGQKLRSGGIMVGKYADWQWFGQGLGLQTWSYTGTNKLCCFICKAGKNCCTNCFDFGLNAGWRFTKLTTEEFLAGAS